MCLQGEMQAARIEQLLVERLGPAVFRERRLRCGNPYVFQGDERDVMFISMVAAPNVIQRSLTEQMYQQRFNVAMSRARDQVWLFHSIQEDELGPHCLRRRVIEFFKQLPDQRIQGAPFDIPALQLAAKRADRSVEDPPSPFDSWFEIDVALALAARGYALSAQVEVARKFIDLVIEGNDGVRLAVECDGEAWHGPDHYEKDTARQRQLERAKWTFVRVRESLFYSDPDKAMSEVIAACDECGIEPGDGHNWRQTSSAERAEPSVSSLGGNTIVANDRSGDHPASLFVGDGLDIDRVGLAENRDRLAASLRAGPFTGYDSKHYPDPRTAPPSNVREAVLDIITTDGPLSKASVYRLYRDGCPRVERAGKYLRQAVNRAISALERSRQIETRDEGSRKLVEEVVCRVPSQNWVDCRPVGAREFEEIPLAELAEQIVLASRGGQSSVVQTGYKSVAKRYGVTRLREQVSARLEAAAQIALDVSRAAKLGVGQRKSGSSPLSSS